jgi:hypothetical protein
MDSHIRTQFNRDVGSAQIKLIGQDKWKPTRFGGRRRAKAVHHKSEEWVRGDVHRACRGRTAWRAPSRARAWPTIP